jgi:hypothetical protein
LNRADDERVRRISDDLCAILHASRKSPHKGDDAVLQLTRDIVRHQGAIGTVPGSYGAARLFLERLATLLLGDERARRLLSRG